MSDESAYVRVSPRDARYFELSNGRPYIPIGLNLVGNPPAEQHRQWLDVLAASRCTYCRIWLGQAPFDVEHDKSGVYDPANAQVLKTFLDLAQTRGIKVKLCLEYFRDCPPERHIWSDKVLHNRANGGPFADMHDLLTHGQEQWKRKLAWWQQQIGDHPAVWGWEIWNEMDAVHGSEWLDWTRTMLPELHRLFPRNLAVQSLGSFDHEHKRDSYRTLVTMPGNDVAQVHRYLDLGAAWEVCHGPVDVLAAEAVRELLAMQPGKPVILTESGAVEPNHAGPFKLYAQDHDGTLLHDLIWGAFMAGAAGPGHTWHWDHYVQQVGVWWQYERFATAVGGIDPAAEGFTPSLRPDPRLRIYALQGRKTVLLWCRDSHNDWTSELRDGKAPETLTDQTVNLAGLVPAGDCRWRVFDPWTGIWTDVTPTAGKLTLPAFRRSLVVRCDVGPRATVTNPLVADSADPWITTWQGDYLYTYTTDRNITLVRSRHLGDLAKAERKVVFAPPPDQPCSRHLWAPELYRLDGKWYVYFCACDGPDANHRLWVLEGTSDDPLGEYRLLGKVSTPGDCWAIDGTVFEWQGRRYLAWSGWDTPQPGPQRIFLGELTDPLTVPQRVKLSQADLPWEQHGHRVNEGPEALIANGRLHLAYSANPYWLDEYCLGLLTLTGGDPLDPAHWTKRPTALFQQGHGVKGVGHGSFFRSPDGTEWWQAYHAHHGPRQGGWVPRDLRVQPFTFDAAGLPVLGEPVASGAAIPAPSGE